MGRHLRKTSKTFSNSFIPATQIANTNSETSVFRPRTTYPPPFRLRKLTEVSSEADKLLQGRRLYFPRHQSAALQKLQYNFRNVDLVVEVRDARIPFSSVNPALWKTLLGNSIYRSNLALDKYWKTLATTTSSRPYCVVYNKMDLANHNTFDMIKSSFKRYTDSPVFFTKSVITNHDDKNGRELKAMMKVDEILNYAKRIQRANPTRYPYLVILVVGMPNIGKSSLINRLRNLSNRASTSQVAPQPGVTKKIQTRVKICDNPLIYIVDTPGIVDPHIYDAIQYLKIALIGGIPDHNNSVDYMEVADYLLFVLNNTKNFEEHSKCLGLNAPSDDINIVMRRVAEVNNFWIGKKGEQRVDLHHAALHMIRKFRKGEFGRITLDDVEIGSLDQWVEKWDK
ncbi:Mitochondrial GTPase [Nowakowskiella sp. JEL0078]|nr:Mitochondrial GTPase [Nowakowskiella sp. JEL0078]